MAKTGIIALNPAAALVLALALAFLLPQPLVAQTSDPQALTLAAQAIQALNHGVPVSDVTLTGTATQAGSRSITGSATFKALAAAQGYAKTRADFSASSQSEIRTLDTHGRPTGAWALSDGVRHTIALHNSLTDAAWFFPALTLLRAASQQGVVARYIGAETHNGVAVKHLRLWRLADSSLAGIASVIPRLSTVDVYLDSVSSLPVALAFFAHTDRDINKNWPVEIRYLDYRQVAGVSIPFHVQKYLNGSVLVDFQASQATINSGLTDAQFQ